MMSLVAAVVLLRSPGYKVDHQRYRFAYAVPECPRDTFPDSDLGKACYKSQLKDCHLERQCTVVYSELDT